MFLSLLYPVAGRRKKKTKPQNAVGKGVESVMK
jgi:hypothetical protein